MTFAIAARTEDGWVAGTATYPMNVGRNVLSGLPGVGIALTLAYSQASTGAEALARISAGASASEALLAAQQKDESPRWQVALLGTTEGDAFTGADCTRYAQHHVEESLVTVANLMTNPGVPEALADAWHESSGGNYRDRIVSALRSAQSLGGDLRGLHSAAYMSVGLAANTVQVAEVNFDEHDPVAALADAEIVDIANRPPPDDRFDLIVNDCWFALLQGDVARAKKASTELTDVHRRYYPGACDYLELAVSASIGQIDDAQAKADELSKHHPEWVEFARRGADFSTVVLPLLR